jgi:hypothetical protein
MEGPVFSRWMPRSEPPQGGMTSRVTLAVLGLTALWALWYLAHHPVGAALTSAFVGAVWLVGGLLDRRVTRLAHERAGEDIGTFARAFDRRATTFDPWVVRAVWDALAPWTELRGGGRLALRPADVIAELGCVDEDLDDVLRESVTRARHSLHGVEGNPYYGRVVTVGDLVAFISHQPRVATA